jgi:hypothetical protein
MTAAIFGLVGVVVGAVINAAMTGLLQKRTEASDRRTAARLVRSELVRYRSLAQEAALRPADQLPQLQEAAPVIWQSYRAVLARALREDEWSTVARAYAHVDALVSVLVFEPDGTLVEWRRREAQRLLTATIEPVEQAAATLRAGAGDVEYPVDAYPEQGPVAA